MGVKALLIRESDQRSRGAGVFLLTLILMWLIRPNGPTPLAFSSVQLPRLVSLCLLLDWNNNSCGAVHRGAVF